MRDLKTLFAITAQVFFIGPIALSVILRTGTLDPCDEFSRRGAKENAMKLAAISVAFALIAGPALAVDNNNAQNKGPGQQMQDKGSVKGSPGASGYAPGHKMQDKGSVKGTTGASGYAPGHATTGSGDKK